MLACLQMVCCSELCGQLLCDFFITQSQSHSAPIVKRKTREHVMEFIDHSHACHLGQSDAEANIILNIS